jgi:homoserine trans-succinylase
MNTEDLEKLARRKDKPDIYLGKDMQFHKIWLTPNWQELDPDELSKEYMSDEEPEDESLEPEPVFDAENPRRSKRART